MNKQRSYISCIRNWIRINSPGLNVTDWKQSHMLPAPLPVGFKIPASLGSDLIRKSYNVVMWGNPHNTQVNALTLYGNI